VRIGITGERGFVGKAVAGRLSECKYDVVPLGDWTYQWNSDGAGEIAADAPGNLDWVLHMGARTSIAAAWDNPFGAYSNNLGSTLAALEIARKSGASFLFMSSYVYGVPQYLPLDEEHPIYAINPYMGSKLLGEELCRQWSQLYGKPLVVLRAFNIYGDSLHPGRLISDLIRQARKKERLEIEDAEPKRDYLYVNDFAELMQKIVETKPVPSGVYNVGTGESHANGDVAEMVRDLLDDRRPVKIRKRRRLNDVLDCTADVSKVQAIFGWQPRYTLRHGLTEILEDRIDGV
jgi:nucleoside-diphosphate-sugar epimerase